jgi:hypothetical protein
VSALAPGASAGLYLPTRTMGKTTTGSCRPSSWSGLRLTVRRSCTITLTRTRPVSPSR